MAAIWDKIQEQLSNLWDTILDAVKNWIMEQIVTKMVTKLLSMLDPTGIMAVVNSAIALYKAIQSFIKYLREMLEIVNSFVEGVVDIASGNIATAANYLERTLARAIPIIIGFLANQVGLSGIGKKIGEMIGIAREMVDKALTWLVNKAVDTGMNLIDRLMGRGPPQPGEPPVPAAVHDFPDIEASEPFRMGDHDHTITFTSRGGVVEITMASDLRINLPLYLSQAIEQVSAMDGFDGKDRILTRLKNAYKKTNEDAVRELIGDWNMNNIEGTRARSQPEFIKEKLLRVVEDLADLSVGEKEVPAIVGLFDFLNKNTTSPGKYGPLIPDPVGVVPFAPFSDTQRKKVIDANETMNGGVIKSDCVSGQVLHDDNPNDALKANVDHIYPRAKGGSNSYSNAQVISRADNLRKSDTKEGCP